MLAKSAKICALSASSGGFMRAIARVNSLMLTTPSPPASKTENACATESSQKEERRCVKGIHSGGKQKQGKARAFVRLCMTS